MRKSLEFIAAYLALLALSLVIPLFHLFRVERAIEGMRPVFKMADGSMDPGLMPVMILNLRWLGQLSWIFPVVGLGLFALSWKREAFRQFDTICLLAVFQCGFATFYGIYAAWLLLNPDFR